MQQVFSKSIGWNPSLSYTAEACDGHSGIAVSLPKQVGLLERGKQPLQNFCRNFSPSKNR